MLYFFKSMSWAESVGRAGPGRSDFFFENVMSRTGPRVLKIGWAGPGRAESFEKLVGRAGLSRELYKFDGPGRAAAHRVEI